MERMVRDMLRNPGSLCRSLFFSGIVGGKSRLGNYGFHVLN
jgi:hypothetical protein